jgi:Ca-activated chloride channel family protein
MIQKAKEQQEQQELQQSQQLQSQQQQQQNLQTKNKNQQQEHSQLQQQQKQQTQNKQQQQQHQQQQQQQQQQNQQQPLSNAAQPFFATERKGQRVPPVANNHNLLRKQYKTEKRDKVEAEAMLIIKGAIHREGKKLTSAESPFTSSKLKIDSFSINEISSFAKREAPNTMEALTAMMEPNRKPRPLKKKKTKALAKKSRIVAGECDVGEEDDEIERDRKQRGDGGDSDERGEVDGGDSFDEFAFLAQPKDPNVRLF